MLCQSQTIILLDRCKPHMLSASRVNEVSFQPWLERVLQRLKEEDVCTYIKHFIHFTFMQTQQRRVDLAPFFGIDEWTKLPL